MAHAKQTEVRKETINRLKQRIGLDLATMYVNYGMTLDVCDKLMECMGWTAWECLEWDEQQEKERGKKPRMNHLWLGWRSQLVGGLVYLHSKRSESFRRAPNYSSNFLCLPDLWGRSPKISNLIYVFSTEHWQHYKKLQRLIWLEFYLTPT